MGEDSERARGRRVRRWAILPALAVIALAMVPAAASATVQTYEYEQPTSDEGYSVKQGYLPAPHPNLNGFVTHMNVNIVDADGTPVPIRRLMLHHIVFSNLSRHDATCDSFLSWNNRTQLGGVERFYAAGEERNVLDLPPGYGYRLSAGDVWGIYYMVMNHRSTPDDAYIRYRVTVDTDPTLTPVKPYWFDVRNCLTDPVYNVRGTGPPGSTDVERRDFVIPTAGRIVAGGGHLHGGGKKLTLTEPRCNHRRIARSVPAWGMRSHPFYKVRPKLHEPGPIDMSAWATPTGIPVAAGERLRLKSFYDASRPHLRVMGISIVYIAPDPTVEHKCGRLPDDVRTVRTDKPHRPGPVPYRVPLTGLDEDGRAVTIKAPPGPLERVPSVANITVKDRFFSRPNVSVRRDSKLRWRFAGGEVHNVTLANGPVGFASRNLDQDRWFVKRFRKPGTYRFFCALHPVQMTERVVVRRRR